GRRRRRRAAHGGGAVHHPLPAGHAGQVEKPLRPRQRQGKIAGAGNPILAGLRLLLAQERSRQSRSCTPCALRRRDLEHGGSLSCAPPLTTSKRSRCAWHTSMATAPRLMNLLSKGSTLLSGMASCPTRG